MLPGQLQSSTGDTTSRTSCSHDRSPTDSSQGSPTPGDPCEFCGCSSCSVTRLGPPAGDRRDALCRRKPLQGLCRWHGTAQSQGTTARRQPAREIPGTPEPAGWERVVAWLALKWQLDRRQGSPGRGRPVVRTDAGALTPYFRRPGSQPSPSPACSSTRAESPSPRSGGELIARQTEPLSRDHPSTPKGLGG
jgi:hypothetical protein